MPGPDRGLFRSPSDLRTGADTVTGVPSAADAQAAFRLVGRTTELRVVHSLLTAAVDRGAALMLTGAAGVGKTALLDVAAQRAAEAGFRVLRVTGSQFDRTVSFAGLHQMLQPLSEEIAALPSRQAATLQAVLGLSEGQPVEFIAIASAVHAVLSQTATRARPLALIVDDAAWLDRPSAMVLGIVSRYVRTGSIALLAASRTGDESFLSGTGMATHEIQPLDDIAATALVAQRFPALTPRVRRRLVAEARGNPLALLELPGTLNKPQQTERSTLPAVLPLTERLKRIYCEGVSALPAGTRKLLLLAVLDGSGDLRTLRRAMASPDAQPGLCPAERGGLVQVDVETGKLLFRHPLTRSAVMELSTSAERRWAHQVLAEEFPAGSERRALHLADAAVGPDEHVAVLLHELAYGTLRRGDAVGAINALLRASELSATGAGKGRRLAEAACLGANVTGDLLHVRDLLDNATGADSRATTSLPAAVAAASQLLNGEGDVDTAQRLLVNALDNDATLRQSDDTMLSEALHTLLRVCFFSGRPDVWQRVDTALNRLHPNTPDPQLPVLRATLGDPAHLALPALPRLDELVSGLHRETDPTRILRTAAAGAYVDRLPGSRSSLRRVVDDGRGGGAVTLAIEALFLLANDAYVTGQWDDITGLTDEGLGWCTTYNYRLQAWPGRFLRGLLAAARGDDRTARTVADTLVSWGNPRGLGILRTYSAHIKALSALGNANFGMAYYHLTSVTEAGRLTSPHDLWLLWDFVEAAAHSGHHAEAAAHLEAIGALGIRSLSPRLAMIADGAAAIADQGSVDRDLFERALATPDAECWPFDLARIHLAYGERLRRARASVAARPHLTAALATFERLGAAPWTTRAANELRATGLQPRPTDPTESRPSPLTPQEWHTAQLAATGLTNKQIAAQLFLSPRTVAAHLRNAYPKLNITSRAGLRDALTGLAGEGEG
ncbi:AAA family ATPase [Streptomyces sp. NPDC002499]